MNVKSAHKASILSAVIPGAGQVYNKTAKSAILPKMSTVGRGARIDTQSSQQGDADIYPRLGPTSEWDIAAGHIILEEAGGSISNLDKNKILYNTKESVINPYFIAKN